jgi:hypothetical protein
VEFCYARFTAITAIDLEDGFMSTDYTDQTPLEEPLSELERQFISEYLRSAGLDYHALVARTDPEARRLLAQAALHASERLSEIEARSHYIHKLHGDE